MGCWGSKGLHEPPCLGLRLGLCINSTLQVTIFHCVSVLSLLLKCATSRVAEQCIFITNVMLEIRNPTQVLLSWGPKFCWAPFLSGCPAPGGGGRTYSLKFSRCHCPLYSLVLRPISPSSKPAVLHRSEVFHSHNPLTLRPLPYTCD